MTVATRGEGQAEPGTIGETAAEPPVRSAREQAEPKVQSAKRRPQAGPGAVRRAAPRSGDWNARAWKWGTRAPVPVPSEPGSEPDSELGSELEKDLIWRLKESDRGSVVDSGHRKADLRVRCSLVGSYPHAHVG